VITRLLLSILLLAVSTAGAQQALPARWLALFEQSYGSEGLYVVEVRPTDEGGAARLDLQIINAATQQWLVENGFQTPSLEALDAAGLIAEVPVGRRADYTWSAERGFFVSQRGVSGSPMQGIVRLLSGNEEIRRRLINPDRFTRERWKKLYEDPAAPQMLKREILLREFMIDNHWFPEVLLYERSQEQLARINDAVRLYGLVNRLDSDSTVTFAMLRESQLFEPLGDVPENVEFSISTVGEKARGTINGVPIIDGASGPMLVRRNRAERLLKARPDFPPAIALAARYRDPAEAVRLLDQAIRLWPDVPGLRVERIGNEARRRNFAGWTRDLDFIVKNAPAAPLLIEIDMAAEAAGLRRNPETYAPIVLMLADVRPDLLTHQLLAIRLLTEIGRHEDAATVYDRLTFANPAWRVAIDRPTP
jgi:tetratricopeptide (TPR) repeat protein